MGDREDRYQSAGFGTPFLSPADELSESWNIADRQLEERQRNNPLARRDAAVLAAAGEPVGALAAAAPAEVVPNPLVKPPSPLGAMPVAQQMAWQQYTALATKQQADLARSELERQIAQRGEEHRVKAIDQAKAIFDGTAGLDPTDHSYPLRRADLVRQHPIGAMTEQGQRALGYLDQIYQNKVSLETQFQKAEDAARRTEDRSRLETARKQAAELGPDVLARFFDDAKVDPEKAISGVMQQAAQIEQANIQAQLQSGGMTQEEIAAKFGGTADVPFKYSAAKAETKMRMTPAQEAANIRSMYTTLASQRQKAGGFDPNFPDNPEWPLAREQIFLKAEADLNALLDRGTGRAGVQGVAPAAPAIPSAPQPAAAAPTSPPMAIGKSGRKYIQLNGAWYPAPQ